ncbi:hypothetical protein MMC31_006625 [Peltigera leucophlebia]|nr:hypothetical protein [Peltigera leucophlebia]
MFLREPCQERHVDLDHISLHLQLISFHHPGYAHPNDIILQLLASDDPSGGLHHLTALTACGIVAGNRFDGYFSTTRNGQAIEDSPDSVLIGKDYWFHVPQSSTDTTMNEVPLTPYPIYASFEQWQFPHDSLPTSWQAFEQAFQRLQSVEQASIIFAESSLTAATKHRDSTCRITASGKATDVAHVIPVNQVDWFWRNDMMKYGRNPLAAHSVNDLSNTILLRADLHPTFDALEWVIIPKPNSEGVMQFVFHLIQPSPELAERYHNCRVYHIAGISPQILFAAFARAIFPSLHNFLAKGVSRWLLAISSQSQKYESKHFSGLECEASFRAKGRGRSNSPKKRKGTDQEDAKEACGSKGASSGDFIQHRRPHNSSSGEGHTNINAIGDQDPCTCTSSSGSDGPYPEKNPAVYCRSANCRYLRLRLDGLEKERERSGTQEWWKAQELWASRAYDNPLSQNEIKRFFWARGVEDATWESDHS